MNGVHPIDQLDADGLRLGQITPSFSGASAAFLNSKVLLQSPWMQLKQVWKNESKSTLYLAMDECTTSWICGVESAAKEQIPQHTRESWNSSVYEDERIWKVNIPSSAALFGDQLHIGALACVVFEVCGVWFWKEMCGLKIKVSQVKCKRTDTCN